MAEFQGVFKRYEKKYLLSMAQYDALIKQLSSTMQQDQYGLHTICNLYLDTDSYELIRTSLEKPVYKEKIRLRSYGIPQKTDPIFLELKDKYKGVVYKRRISLSLEQAMRYICLGEPPQDDSQILRETAWFMRLYTVSPKVFIAYDRIALFGNQDPSLRITFDTNIRWRETQLDLSQGDWGTPLMDADSILMEIKIAGSMPLWLCHMLTELAIYPVSFSKYGVCYQECLSKKIGGMFCA